MKPIKEEVYIDTYREVMESLSGDGKQAIYISFLENVCQSNPAFTPIVETIIYE